MNGTHQTSKNKVQRTIATSSIGPQKISSKQHRMATAYQTAAVLVFVALGFLIYSNTLNCPFVFDDQQNIQENLHIRLTKLNLNNIIDAGFKSRGSRRPIANISFALNYYFHQYNVFGYHLVNIIVHILTATFFYFFVKNTLHIPLLRNKYSGFSWIPFAAALLWLVHPIQTQAVTYIVQRMTSLAAMFYILSLLCYIKGRFAIRDRKKCWPWFTGCLFAAILAFGCKQITATLPLFILLYEWYFFRDLSTSWLKRNLPYIIGVFVVFGLIGLLYLGTTPLDSTLQAFERRDFTMTERLLTQFRIVIYYIGLLIFPHPGRLNLDYDFAISHSLTDPPTTLICIGAIIGFIALAVYTAKKERLLSFCILWFFGNLVIESSVLALELVFEHRLYLPSILVCLAIVSLANRLIKRNRIKPIIFCLVAVLFCLWTYKRNTVWSGPVALWTDCVNKSPKKARPHDNLGIALQSEGRLNEAISHFRQALQLDPNDVKAHNNLGNALASQGKFNEAVSHYRQALQISSNYADTYNNLGNTLASLGKFNEAISCFHKALQLNPSHAEAHNNLGSMLSEQGNLDEAIGHYRQALKVEPDNADVHCNLGIALQSKGVFEEATTHYRRALRTRPHDAKTHNNLGVALMIQGKINEAAGHFHQTLQIQPDYLEALSSMARILATHPNPKMRDANRAINLAEQAAELINYKDASVLDTLAASYAAAGQLNKAVTTAQAALELASAEQNTELADHIRKKLLTYQRAEP